MKRLQVKLLPTIMYVGLAILLACSTADKPAMEAAPEDQPSATYPGYGATDAPVEQPVRSPQPYGDPKAKQVIKEAEVSFQVNDFIGAYREILSLVGRCNGYISREDVINSPHQLKNVLLVRVPGIWFDTLMYNLPVGIDSVDYMRIKAQDETLHYYRTRAAMQSKTLMIDKFEKLLQKTTDMEKIREIEQQLQHLRQEKQQQQNTLSALDDRIAYSTAKIIFYQPIRYVALPPTFPEKAITAFRVSWNAILDVVVAIIYIWPLLLLLGLLTWRFKDLKAWIRKKPVVPIPEGTVKSVEG